MNYYRLDNPEFDEYPSYLELDNEFYCLRQVVDFESEIKNTSLCITDDFFLPEGTWKDVLEDIKEYEISKKVFDEKWQQSLEKHLPEWEKLKIQTPLGKPIEANIVCFYPQGVVLDIGEKFYGIAPYEPCKMYFGAKKMYPKNCLSLQVVGFDEVNLWVKLAVQPT